LTFGLGSREGLGGSTGAAASMGLFFCLGILLGACGNVCARLSCAVLS